MKIKIKKLHPDAKIPNRIDEGCGGWDLTCTEIKCISDDFYICKLGLMMQPVSPNYKITIVPRSSFTKTNWVLQNSPALIDQSFLGEFELRFRAIPTGVREDSDSSWGYYLTYPEFPFKVGDRIAQMYLEEVIPIEWDETDEFEQTTRGTGGFGSTGK